MRKKISLSTRGKISASAYRSWANPEIRAKRLAALRSPLALEEMSRASLRRWSQSGSRQRQIDAYQRALSNPEIRARVSEATRDSWRNPEHRAKRMAWLLDPERRAEWARKISKASLGHIVSAETRAKLRRAHSGKVLSLEHRAKLSVAKIRTWKNPEAAKRFFSGWRARPNRAEQKLMRALNDIAPGQWSYTGAGALVIGGKCPDFAASEQPKLIELFGRYWHRNHNPKDRIGFFRTHGWETLVVYDDELSASDLPERLRAFMNRKISIER